MKLIKLTTLVPFLSIVLIMIACGNVLSQKLKGNGNVIKKEIPIDSFKELYVKGMFNTFLTQSETESLMIEIDENLIDLILIENVNGRLLVEMEEGVEIKKLTKGNIYISLTDINRLDISGLGNVSCVNSLRLKKLNLKNSGLGKTSLDLYCQELDARISGLGGVVLKGEVSNVSIQFSGLGNLRAFDLVSQNLNLRRSGIGNVEVTAEQEITIRSSGIGNVRYKGDPVVKGLNVSGLGNVRKI